MHKNDILLSIIIVTWNTKVQTLECVNSIYSITDYEILKNKIEVIVIDNNSSDGTKEELSEKFPSVKLIVNPANTGYAPACNQGMKAAAGKYTLLLGSDTVLKNYSLTKCIDYLEKNPDCGAVGCKLFYPDGRLQGNCKKFPKMKNAFFTYLSLDRLNYDYDMLWFNYDKTIEADQIATTFLMINSGLLKKINYFDERFRILYNDVDLCKRIWKSGYKIVFLHSAEIFHHGSYSTNKAGFEVRRKMYEDIYLYYRLNFGRKANLLIPVLMFRLLLISIFR